MNNKKFSRMNSIRRGNASYNTTKGCIVLEGGAFRGLYSEAVLDVLMEKDINFECVVGVSAGALNGVNYVAGQIGRSARINLKNRYNKEYIGMKAILKSHSLINLDFLFGNNRYIEPLNKRHFYKSEQRFVAVVTNCLTGKTEYFEKGKDREIMKAVKASATMPYISPPVEIGGIPYYDGGCSCKIAYKWAIDEGYDKIIVVKTRDDNFRKEVKDKVSHIPDIVYRKYPEFAKSLAESDINYNRQCDEIQTLREKGRLFVISPSQEVTVDRVERNVEKLGELYELGLKDIKNALPMLMKYLDS